MREKVNDAVSVVMYYSAKQRHFRPHMIHWQNRDYMIGEIGFHHQVREGRVLHHIFECADDRKSIAFRLNFDTATLGWTLETVSDGMGS